MKNDCCAYPSSRLFSLDALRGLDMIFLTVVQPMLVSLDRCVKLPDAVMGQLRHGWECFTAYDIIMPLFIFMCGAAIPFALPKRLVDGRAGWGYWRHVLGRVALLWVCGMFVQGNLATLDPLQIKLFSNTLQSIAVGYLATAAVLLIPRRVIRVAIPFALFAVYGLLVHFCGDYTQDGNATALFERAVDGIIYPKGNVCVAKPSIYTWYLPSMMFAAMTLCGFHATEILRSGMTAWRKAGASFGYGAGMLAAGWLLSVWVPVIKPIYTVSFTLQAMGWCELALATLFVVNDIWQVRRGWGAVILFGQFALTAYLVSHVPFRPALDAFAKFFAQGFPRILGDKWQPMAVWAFCTVGIVGCLLVRRRLKART